jgi:hypothetical protein
MATQANVAKLVLVVKIVMILAVANKIAGPSELALVLETQFAVAAWEDDRRVEIDQV